MMNKFEGQYKTEKVLYQTREYIVSYILSSLKYSFVYLGIYFFIIFLFFVFELSFVYVLVLSILFAGFGIFSFFIFRIGNRFIISNKRIIKLVKSGFFRNHTNEIKLSELNKFSFKKIGISAKIFNYGTIRIISKDEHTTIWGNGIKHPNEVIQYVSRLRDFLDENPKFDHNKLQKFKTRKERKLK